MIVREFDAVSMSLMIVREFDAGCKNYADLGLIVLPVCWLERHLVT